LEVVGSAEGVLGHQRRPSPRPAASTLRVSSRESDPR